MSIALAVDGVPAARMLIELRHEAAPSAVAAFRAAAAGYCGSSLAYEEGRLACAGAGTAAAADGDSAAALGHWSRGVVSLAPDGGFVLLLGPCELPGYRPVGQLVKGYVGLSYVEAAAQVVLCNKSLSSP